MLNYVQADGQRHQICVEGLQSLKNWIKGEATVADCRAHALKIHELARSASEPREQDALRSIGHAIATAHVSRHLEAARKYEAKVLE